MDRSISKCRIEEHAEFSTLIMFSLLLDHFTIKLFNLRANQGQNLGAFLRQAVLPAGMGGRIAGPNASKPSVLLHALKQGVESARTYLVTMPSEFIGYPLTVDGSLRRVVQDVNLPKAQKDLSGHDVGLRRR